MPLTIDGATVFRIGEALERAGVSRATYFRWVKCGRIEDARYRDRNGRRVFTYRELRTLEDAANHLVAVDPALKSQLRLDLAN